MGLLKTWYRKCAPNPFVSELRRAKKREVKTILIPWNRGLGDIALGLYALNRMIKEKLPQAQIHYVTRSDLAEGFSLLEDVTVHVDPSMRRGEKVEIPKNLANEFDYVIENPDPTYWCHWQLGKLTPTLSIPPDWLHPPSLQELEGVSGAIGIHVHSETSYGYEKNWPEKHWKELFCLIRKQTDAPILLFGFGQKGFFEEVIDLRGKTSLSTLTGTIYHCCTRLVLPDSGILSLLYYYPWKKPLRTISLWADDKQGVLKQNVPSPNPLFSHTAMVGKEKDVKRVLPFDVCQQLFQDQASCHKLIF